MFCIEWFKLFRYLSVVDIVSKIMRDVELDPLNSYRKLVFLCKSGCTLRCFERTFHLVSVVTVSLIQAPLLHLPCESEVLQHLCNDQNTQLPEKSTPS